MYQTRLRIAEGTYGLPGSPHMHPASTKCSTGQGISWSELPQLPPFCQYQDPSWHAAEPFCAPAVLESGTPADTLAKPCRNGSVDCVVVLHWLQSDGALPQILALWPAQLLSQPGTVQRLSQLTYMAASQVCCPWQVAALHA